MDWKVAPLVHPSTTARRCWFDLTEIYDRFCIAYSLKECRNTGSLPIQTKCSHCLHTKLSFEEMLHYISDKCVE